jgi:hypothetical protein
MIVRPTMRAKVSKISLCAFVMLLVLSGTVATISGKYWPFYAFTSAFAVVPVFVGPRRYRLIGVGALLLCAVLIAHDIAAGKRFRAQNPQIQWTH